MKSIAIKREKDLDTALQALRDLAAELGFDQISINKMEVAVSELATNFLVHQADSGEIILNKISDSLGSGIEIIARDCGPGISDVQEALKDHTSKGESMGCGLGAVRRLMDDFEIQSVPVHLAEEHKDQQSGTVVKACKWLKTDRKKYNFQRSVYSRPRLGERANGDAYYLQDLRDGLFIAVADGLGHGPPAAEASKKAMDYIRNSGPLPMDRLISQLHKELRKTWGIALTLLKISLMEGTLYHAGIGNVEARIYPQAKYGLIPKPGILGSGIASKPKVTSLPWPRGGTLFVYTDGLSAHWNWQELPALNSSSIVQLSKSLFDKYSRPHDDATLVAVREAD